MTAFLKRPSVRLAGVVLGCALGVAGTLEMVGRAPVAIAQAVQSETEAQAEAAATLMARGQQTYRQKNKRYTNSVATLKSAFGIATVPGYSVSIRTSTRGAYHYFVPRDRTKKSFVSAVFLEESEPTQGGAESVWIVCESNNPQNFKAASPSYVRGSMRCNPLTIQKAIWTGVE